MANRKVPTQRHAYGVAAITVVFMALFAMAFIGVVLLLDNYASSLEQVEEIEVATVKPVDPMYVLLIGSDSRKGTAQYTGKETEHAQVDQHSDIMTLMRIDPKTYRITLISVPRDTVLADGAPKINDALLENNPEEVVAAVGELTGVYADYYMMTSFISFENLVNAFGGIDVAVPKTVSVTDPATGKSVKVNAGKNRHLNGAQALVLSRSRSDYGENQEALRQVNVRAIERALIDKVLSMDGSLDIEHVLTALDDDTKTNLDLPTVGLLIVDFVEHADEVVIYDCTGPYAGGERESDGLWVIDNDPIAWRQIIALANAGEDPSSVVPAPEFK